MKRARALSGVLAGIVLLWTGVARAQANVTFTDPNLEAAVCSALGVPAGPLTADQVGTLTSLYTWFPSVTDLTGLEYATNLQTLFVRFGGVSDLGPISALPHLAYLYVPQNHVSDLRCLTNLVQLKALDINFNGVHDATPLLALTNLESLNVSYNPLSNPAVLGGLTSLRLLTLNYVSITDLSFANGLSNLTQLSLIQDQIATLPPLPGLGKLEVLDLTANPLTNAMGVASLTNLTSLSLSQCPLADLSFLPALQRLQSLNIYGNSAANNAVLGSLTNLQGLYAESCSLSNLSIVRGLTQLQTLDLLGNRISDLDGLQDLNGLQYLYLGYNRLTDIAELNDAPGLKLVSLVGNLLDLTAGSPALTVIGNLMARGVSVAYDPQNQPPTIQVSTNWTVPVNRTCMLYLYVIDDVTFGSNITVTVTSADTNLVPQTALSLQFVPDVSWNLVLTNPTNQPGTTTLTIAATDDTGYTTTTNVSVTVFAPPAVTLVDTNLEAVVRNALGLPSGPVTTYDLQSLNYLSAGWAQIRNLTGLEWATNLTTLYLSGNTITDLTPLRGLPVLQNLDLSYNNLRDLALVAGLTNLTVLTLDGNPSVNLATLPDLPKLTSLSAYSCALSNLAGIGSLTGLQSLSLGYNNLRDLSPLTALTNLTSLSLQNNPLGSTAGLAGLSKLQQLYLTGCSLREVNGLAALTNLTTLSVDYNPLTSVAPLAGLPHLTWLNAGGCSVSNLLSLQGLTALQSLYLYANGIRDISPLRSLTNLTALSLGANSPDDLTPLQSLPALTTLDLTSCSLSNVTALAPLTQLRSFNLPYNYLVDITPLLGLTNLYTLYLDGERLTNINGLQSLTGLRYVSVELNLLDISDGSPAMMVVTNLQNQGAWVGYAPQNQPPTFYSRCTNWVIRPNVPATFQFQVVDDVTRADKVTASVACSSPGPLSNSAVTLVRTSFSLPPGTPMRPIPFPPPIIIPRPPGTVVMHDLARPILPYGGGISSWELKVTPTLSQTGSMSLTLTATDDTGFTSTQAVVVTVAQPEPLDAAILDATNLTWQTGGNAPWFGQTNVSRSGSAAAQSGSVGAGEEAWLQTTVTGPGILTFWWNRAAYSYGGECAFTTSRGGSLALFGTTDWQMERVSIPAGECVLTWDYIGGQFATTSDRCWLDQVSFVPTSQNFWLEMAPNPAPSLPTVTLHGEPSGFYEVQVSADLVHWTVLNQAALNTAQGDFTAPVAYASAQTGPSFYRARQLPAGTMWFGPLAFEAAGAPVLQLHGKPGTSCELLSSTDLFNWSTLTTLSNTTGSVSFTDTQTGAQKFYRARLLP